jgi:hypothetical protein
VNLQPNTATRPYAVLSGVVGTSAVNLLALGFGVSINFPLVLAGCACLLIAIGMEMWVLYHADDAEGDQ